MKQVGRNKSVKCMEGFSLVDLENSIEDNLDQIYKINAHNEDYINPTLDG